MQNFVHEMLHDSPAALKIMSLWQEYEEQSTAEARFVKGGYYLVHLRFWGYVELK